MAGIGFELRKLLRRDNLSSWIRAYAYAGIIGSGPWIISIVGLVFVGFMSVGVVKPDLLVTQFQVSITYLIALSLILTGLVQLAYTRYIADRLFDKRHDLVLPTFMGLLMLTTFVSGVLALPAAFFLFPDASFMFRLLLMSGFVLLSNVWVASVMLTGLKEYKQVLALYALGYGLAIASSLVLRPLGTEGLLLGFVIGQLVLLTGMILIVAHHYPASRFISFEFRHGLRQYPDLMAVGLLFNLALWADKFIFWFNDDTSSAIIGPLRASEIYDFPIFLAYLSIIPGMAVFLLRMETDFVEYYDKFYDAVRNGGSLEYIEEMRNEMVWSARQGLFEIIKIQSLAVLFYFVIGPDVLKFFGISELYELLLMIMLIGAGLQVVFLGLLNVFFYLDRRRTVLLLVALFALLNIGFTLLSIKLGPAWYGYGFAGSLLVVVLLGFFLLDRQLDKLEYRTFMLQ